MSKVIKVKVYPKLRDGTFEYVDAIVDEDSYEKLKDYKWISRRPKAGSRLTKHYPYFRTKIGGKAYTFMMHKVICPSKYPLTTDHINRNSLDNRKCNLRPATRGQQNMNKAKTNHKWNTSKYLGVRKVMKKYYIEREMYACMIEGKAIAYFKTEKEAAIAYNINIVKHRDPSFVCFNEVEV
jgi:hypothetical protein